MCRHGTVRFNAAEPIEGKQSLGHLLQTTQKSCKAWIGYWLLGIAVLHSIYAGVFFGPVYADIIQRGIFNAVGQDPMTGAAVWFAIFGVMMAMLAAAITPMERSGQH